MKASTSAVSMLSFSFSSTFHFEFSKRRSVKIKDSPPDTAINLVQRQFLISSPFWGSVCATSALVAWWGLKSRFNAGSTSRPLFCCPLGSPSDTRSPLSARIIGKKNNGFATQSAACFVSRYHCHSQPPPSHSSSILLPPIQRSAAFDRPGGPWTLSR